ncbi:MAG: nucleotidyltransferase family protein [Thermoplasmata archaeon]
MTKRKVRLGHCHRCIYTWRMRRQYPRICPRCKSRLWKVPKIRPVVLGNGAGIEEVLGPHRSEILWIARKYGVTRVRVFGSVRRREAGEKSDVDLIVTWSAPHSILDRAALTAQIERIVGRAVDVVNEGGLHWAIAPQVEAEAIPL